MKKTAPECGTLDLVAVAFSSPGDPAECKRILTEIFKKLVMQTHAKLVK